MPSALALPVLQLLVEVGQARSLVEGSPLLERLTPWDSINRTHWDEWDRATLSMPEDDLTALFRGVVIAERELRWTGGSVASAIWIYRAIQRRFPRSADAWADWALRESRNCYVPFGTNRSGINSLADYREDQIHRNERRQRAALDEEGLQQAKEARELARRHIATSRGRIQQATSAARDTLIANLRALPAKDRLEHLAWDQQKPLPYYPVDLASDVEEAWASLDDATRQRLLERARAVPRGPWRKWLRDHLPI
jgi:hypothetical protein